MRNNTVKISNRIEESCGFELIFEFSGYKTSGGQRQRCPSCPEILNHLISKSINKDYFRVHMISVYFDVDFEIFDPSRAFVDHARRSDTLLWTLTNHPQ